MGRGCPPPRKFLHFLFQNGEFLNMPALISVSYFLPFRVMPQAVTNDIQTKKIANNFGGVLTPKTPPSYGVGFDTYFHTFIPHCV